MNAPPDGIEFDVDTFEILESDVAESLKRINHMSDSDQISDSPGNYHS